MKVLFFGTPEFAKELLEVLYEENYSIVAVVSQPDAYVGRKKILTVTPTHQFAKAHGIPCIQPVKLKDSIQEILSYEADLILTCAYGQFIPQAILDHPKYGCLNIHPSLLPKYRGGAPIHHAIWKGETETGVSLMAMVKKMDAGDIFAQRKLSIGPEERFKELNERLLQLAKEMLREELPKYFNKALTPVPQKEEEVVFGLNISKEEEKVSFQEESIESLYNHIRALYDWPMAYGIIDGKRMKFILCQKEVVPHSEAIGKFVGFENKALKIACLGGYLYVKELQLEGKKAMAASEFMNGLGRSLVGHCFE